MSQSVNVTSAGSLRHAFPQIIAAFANASGVAVSLTLGPAGLLREQIEARGAFDLFASANMEHPRRLASLGIAGETLCFARNSFCVIARAGLGLTRENFIDVLSAPSVTIGTSTPGDDPSGDYAFGVFDRIEAKYPGWGEALKSRSKQLVGGRNSPPASPGRGPGALVAEDEVDVMMSYYSNARALEGDPAFSVVIVPSEYAPDVNYGLCMRKNAPAAAGLLRDFMLSDEGQRILEAAGFRRAE
jgi:molybdate transport system substrate-binding protein